MAPYPLPVAKILARILRPRRLRRVPTRPYRLFHAREQELDHQPRVAAPVGQAAVEQVVVNDGDRAGRPLQRLLGVQLRALGQVLRARHHRARTHVERGVLRVVEGHRPAAVVMAAVAVHGIAAVEQAVLVDGLRVAAGPVVVHVAVQVQVVAGAQDAGERPGDAGMVEHPPQLGNARQRVVERGAETRGRAAAQLVHRALPDVPVKRVRQVEMKRQIATGDELPHLAVVQQDPTGPRALTRRHAPI